MHQLAIAALFLPERGMSSHGTSSVIAPSRSRGTRSLLQDRARAPLAAATRVGVRAVAVSFSAGGMTARGDRRKGSRRQTEGSQ